MSNINWRTINIDALDPESSYNFDLSTLTPAVQPVSTEEVQQLAGQVRQLLRGGDQEGALAGALENVPYGADDRGKVCSSTTSQTQVDMAELSRAGPCPHRPITIDGKRPRISVLMLPSRRFT